ncbi:MAG: GMC oxidoreductase [Janthinobacterium lividum]
MASHISNNPHGTTDVIVVGYGWCGAIIANEAANAGLNVTVLERGPAVEGNDSGLDELPAFERRDLRRSQNTVVDTFTLRHQFGDTARPLRRLGSFLAGEGMGGGGMLWGATCTRFPPAAFLPGAEQQYGDAARVGADLRQGWGIDYATLEPFYQKAEAVIGVSGQAGANPFEGPRSDAYPLDALEDDAILARYRRSATNAGLHPYPLPSAELAVPYVNPLGIARKPAQPFGTSIATPLNTLHTNTVSSGRIRILTGSRVRKILRDGERATGVRYVDANGEHTLKAEVVALCAWSLQNVRLLLLSNIGVPYSVETGAGVVGKYFTNHIALGTNGFFDEVLYEGPAAPAGLAVSDFDPAPPAGYADPGFLGGATHLLHQGSAPTPATSARVPGDTPRWGPRWKQALRENYGRVMHLRTIGEILPSAQRYLDLDPLYRDAHGDPLLRLNFDWQENDRRLVAFHGGVASKILQEAGARLIEPGSLPTHYDTVTYQNSHASGGAIMGRDPATSVVDTTLRSWDLHNLWVVGTSAFPSSSASPPTLTVAALAYLAAGAIVQQLIGST